MKRFAQLDNNVVTGVLYSGAEPETLPAGRSFIEAPDEVEAGCVYDPETQTFSPSPPRPPARPTRLDAIETKINRIMLAVNAAPVADTLLASAKPPKRRSSNA